MQHDKVDVNKKSSSAIPATGGEIQDGERYYAGLSPRSSQQLIMISPQARHLKLFMFRFKTLVILLSCQMLICVLQQCGYETVHCLKRACMVSKPSLDK